MVKKKDKKVGGYWLALQFKRFRIGTEMGFWKERIEKAHKEEFFNHSYKKGDNDVNLRDVINNPNLNAKGWDNERGGLLAWCLAELEESLHTVYTQIFNDLQVKSSLERDLIALPEKKRPARLMEYYNMGGLNAFEKVIFKMNMQNGNSLPLATEEFMKYVYWTLIILWTALCMFYLLR